MEWCMLVVHTYVVHTQCAMYSSCVCWYGMCIYVRRYSLARLCTSTYCVYVAFLYI